MGTVSSIHLVAPSSLMLTHNEGTVDISLPGFPLITYPMVINTTTELPQEFPFTQDYNGGDTIGIGEETDPIC